MIVVQTFKNYSAHVLQCSQNLRQVSRSVTFFFFFVSQQFKSGPGHLFLDEKQFDTHTHTHTHTHTLDGTLKETSARRSGRYLHKTPQTQHKHPCSQRDSNARSQKSSRWRPIKCCYILIFYIKSCTMRWAGHVAHKGENRNAYRGKSEGRKHLWDFFLHLDGIKPEYMFRKERRRVRTGLICLKIRTSGGPNFGDPKNAGDFQTNWGTVSFWRRTLLCGVS